MGSVKTFESQRHALAYLMGVYLSDGSVSQARGSFGLCVKDEEFRDAVAEAMKLTGARFGLGRHQSGAYRLWENSPYPVGSWLEDTFPAGKDSLPVIPDDLARDLVAGVMDGDGSIHLEYRRVSRQSYYRLVVCGYSWYLGDLEYLFADHGVKMYYRPERPNHNINKESFVREGFYFRMPRKQALLEEYSYG